MPRRRASPDHDRLYRLTTSKLGHVLDKDEYWSLSFLRLFLDRIDTLRIDEPQTAYVYSLIAPGLARQVPGDADRGGYGSAAVARTWESYAQAVAGSACRAVDRLETAAEHFAVGFRLADSIEPATPAWLRGQLHLRVAILCGQRGEAQGLRHLEAAEQQFARAEEPERTDGRAALHMAAGLWRSRQGEAGALLDFARAMKLSDRTTPRGARRFDAAYLNLLRAMVAAPVHDRVAALAEVTALRNRMRGTGLRALYVRWSEARLRASLQLHQEAARALAPLREHLRTKSTALDFALVSLDLILSTMALGRLDAVRRLAQDTAETLAAPSGDTNSRDRASGELLSELITLLESRATLSPEKIEPQREFLLARGAAQRQLKR